MKTKETYLAALFKFVSQRPGLEFGHYGSAAAYRSESRRITRQRHDFRRLAHEVELLPNGISAEKLIEASKSAFSGRLTFVEKGDKVGVDYCAGQYFPTEYRAAACAVLASALWDYYRANIPPETENKGDKLRAKFCRMFGASIASRWFD
jgi:hypothetical protein